MAGRSRKRRHPPAARGTRPAAAQPPAAVQAPPAKAQPPPAKAQPPPAAGQPPPAKAQPPPATTQRPSAGPRPPSRSRSEERNAAVRATLTPLAPGERPWPLKAAVVIALLIGAGDLAVVIVDGSFRVGGAHSGAGGVVLFSVLMLVCAWGMWQLRYWAVLGFQAILAFVILFFSLLLTRANNLLAVVAALAILGGSGYLFYKLVRILSRLQMPKRP